MRTTVLKLLKSCRNGHRLSFQSRGIDKVSDAVELEAYRLDGQVVHIDCLVNLKSWAYNVSTQSSSTKVRRFEGRIYL